MTDFNRDGAPDIVICNYGDDSVSILLNAAGTFVQLRRSMNPSNSGDPVTFTALIQGSVVPSPLPTGHVLFKDGTKTLGSILLSQGKASFTTSTLSKGSHNITAVYNGSAKFIPNSRRFSFKR